MKQPHEPLETSQHPSGCRDTGETEGPQNALGRLGGCECKLQESGVFKGMHGLRGLLNAQEFWDKQDYGTRLYYGPGIADYLHRDVLAAAVRVLDQAGGEQDADTDATVSEVAASMREIRYSVVDGRAVVDLDA